MGALIALHKASKSYGDIRAFYDVTLTINQGEIIALVGPNGSGKTTLLRSLVGLALFSNGSGQQVLGKTPPIGIAERKKIFYVPDEDSLIDNITPLEYFGLVAESYGAPVSNIERAIDSLRALDFEAARLTDTLKTYSHGMRKKVQLAASWIPDVNLTIIDEPTNGLDPTAIILLRAMLQKAVTPQRTLLLSTHNLPFAEQIAKRVLLMKNAVLYDGTLPALRQTTRTKTLEKAYERLVVLTKKTTCAPKIMTYDS